MGQLDSNKSSLNRYMLIPVIMSVILFLINIVIFIIDFKAGLVLLVPTWAFIVVTFLDYFILRKDVLEEIQDLASSHEHMNQKVLDELPVPYVITDQSGQIHWANDLFKQMIPKEERKKEKLFELFPSLGKRILDKEVDHATKYVDMAIAKEEKENKHYHYRVELKRTRGDREQIPEDLEGKSKEEIRRIQEENMMIIAYFFDETKASNFREKINDQKLVAGLIYIDNYEEVLESADDVKHTMLLTLVDRRINKLLSNLDAIVKKIEKDKYLVFFQQKYLEKLKSTKFSILDDVRSLNVGNEMAMTLSIALAVNHNGYMASYEAACQMMDLALGRGGDQAIIKDGENISYYGGKTQAVEKTTRVKARVKAHALREIMETKEQIFVMGHKNADTDSIGSAIGIYRMAKTLQKDVHIILDKASVSVRQMLQMIREDSEYDKNMFITSEKALAMANSKKDMLVVVDVNNPGHSECEELLKKIHTVVVIDHHRRMKDAISNATLSYIEPYASSSCELVAEILQYVATKPKLRPVEADAMYSGILIDTNNFVVQTGVRTFEAAAFLRRSGADVTRVRKVFRDSMETYKVRARIMEQAELYQQEYAIGTLDGTGMDSPAIIGAQVANELLDIEGIKASFVLTSLTNAVYISARSIDEINVQIIMEQLGGGGHMTVAGAQIKDVDLDTAKEILKGLLIRMKEEGDI